jgi:hypothetical protein
LKYFRTGTFAILRRPVGWIAAYALVLQLLLGALAGAQFSATAADQNWSFIEICFGKRAPDGALPDGKPVQQASKSFGCAVCAAAAAAPSPEAPAIVPVAFSIRPIEWVACDENLSRREFFFPQRQRAPPFEA